MARHRRRTWMAAAAAVAADWASPWAAVEVFGTLNREKVFLYR